MTAQRVAVAMSGGVDSSVAAFLLKQAGHDVFGLHMRLHPQDSSGDLVSTCHLLGIPLFELDLQDEFKQRVISYFCEGYCLGQTPNPCVVCNQEIKFGLLLERALGMGAGYLATGHYARVEHSGDGYRLLRAADKSKDQSYFLYTLGQRQLEHIIFPLAELTKKEVRGIAEGLGLPASRRRDSQDVCFIPGGDYRSFISRMVALKAGDVVDITGNKIGEHGGLALFTVGQRHGLGLASGRELYVLRLDSQNNQVVVGNQEQLMGEGLVARNLSWVSGRPPQGVAGLKARLRYRAPDIEVGLDVQDGTARVSFSMPQAAVTPGQSVVFYQGEVVIGGGIIGAVLR